MKSSVRRSRARAHKRYTFVGVTRNRSQTNRSDRRSLDRETQWKTFYDSQICRYRRISRSCVNRLNTVRGVRTSIRKRLHDDRVRLTITTTIVVCRRDHEHVTIESETSLIPIGRERAL